MISRWVRGVVTVIDEQAGRFLVLQQPLETAMEQLQEHGLSAAAARAALNVKVSDAQWRAAFVNAAAATAVAIEQSLKSVPDSSSDLDDIRKSQATLGEALATIQQDVAADRLNQERRELEEYLDREAERRIGVSLSLGVRRTGFLVQKTWEALWQSPEGLRLAEIRHED